MKHRLLYLIMLVCVAAMPAWAAPSLTRQATEAYDSELYNDALRLYRQAERTQGTSSALYYNMGNTCYRLKDYPHAVLYLERALRLDPGNDDARYNLELVRTKAQLVDESHKNYLLTQIDRLVGLQSSNAWAVMALAAFIAMLVCAGMYLLLDAVALRKVGFFGGIVMLVACAITLWCAMAMYGRTAHSSAAIVMSPEVLLSDSPRAVATPAKAVGRLQAGAKVTITDSITTADRQVWYAIDLDGHTPAWLNKTAVELI